MSEDNPTTNWPWLVAGGMFELKTPLNVVRGYVAVLEAERCGPVTEKQRSALQEIQKAALYISAIHDALAGLASLEGAGWGVPQGEKIFLAKLLSEVASLPLLGNLVAPLDIRATAEHDVVLGHVNLLRHAIAGLARSVAMDQLDGKRPLSIWVVDPTAETERWMVLAATDQIEEAAQTSRASLSRFDERPGRFRMDLHFAGGIVRAHGGQLLALPTGLSGAVVSLPRPTGE